MKAIHVFATACLFALILLSCEKENDINTSNINAKWEVTSPNSSYKSFEFSSDGFFLVVKSNIAKSTSEEDSCIFGTYNLSDQTVVLENFGRLEIKELANNQLAFSFKLITGSSESIDIAAKKTTEMSETPKTNLLCRTWKLDRINGKSVVGKPEEFTVFFSKARTYFVQYRNPDEDHENGLALWKWGNTDQNFIYYSWDETFIDEEENKVHVNELTASKLVMTEYYHADLDGENFEVFELSPVASH